MKPKLLKVPRTPAHSFSVREDRDPFINNRWHYHVEVELIFFHHGSGTQFVGDHIKRFQPGDIILVGSNLPHYWRYDDVYFNETRPEPVHSTVIHFSENFWGDTFLELPETKPIRNLLEKARRGILVHAREKEKIPAHIEKIRLAAGVGRINAIYDYTFRHFTQKIYLDQVAIIAGLVPNSFCRYFKSRTGKTYTQFLTEIRIGHACKLLLDNRISIKQLCFESGFSNFTSFHKSFRLITGKTPQSYLKEHGID